MKIENSNSERMLNLDFVSTVMLLISIFLLSSIAVNGSLTPIILYILMIIIGIFFIIVFSNKNEIFLKIKLFILFFSLYLTYTMIHHYILVNFFTDGLPYVYIDEPKYYKFSELGLPYVSGERNPFTIFTDVYRIRELIILHGLPLHVLFSSLIAHISIVIDGSNSIVALKLLAPFFGANFIVVLYSTLKYQFQNTEFVLKASIIYGLVSAVFMYSTVLLRDIDIALFYMIFIYIFLRKNSYVNFIILIVIAFLTSKLRSESGLVLYGISIIYAHLIIKKYKSTSLKSMLYIAMLSIVLVFIYLSNIANSILMNINQLDEGYALRANIKTSKDSFAAIFDKLPPGLSHTAKILFSQLKPFPLLKFLETPLLILNGLFWPFIDIMMMYAVLSRNIRSLLEEKIKFLLIVSIIVMLLMSASPLLRRLMSVYPVIYIVALYAIVNMPKNKVKKIFNVYLLGIISLNVFYYLLKIKMFL